MHADFAGDALLFERLVAVEQAQLAGRAQMKHVEPSSVALGQRNRLFGTSQAGFRRTDQRMHRHSQARLAVQSSEAFHVGPYGRLVLAVRGDRHGRLGEQGAERTLVVDEHVAGRRAHEELDAADPLRVEATDLLDIVVRRAEVERVVDHRGFGRPLELFFQQSVRYGGRLDVGHIHVGGHSSRRRRDRFAVQIALVGQTRLAEVHLVVDHAGQHVHSFRVDRFAVELGTGIVAPSGPRDALALDDDPAPIALPLVDDRPAPDQQAAHHARGLIVRKRSFSTPKNASRKMPPLIFDAPCVRSVKIIGTSLIRKPSFHAVYFIST